VTYIRQRDPILDNQQAATAAQHVNTEQARCGAANSMERQFGLFYAHQKQLKK